MLAFLLFISTILQILSYLKNKESYLQNYRLPSHFLVRENPIFSRAIYKNRVFLRYLFM